MGFHEIGRVWDNDFPRLVVADEISPDCCRLWDVETGQKLDKDVFRQDLGNLADAYTEVARRLGVASARVRRVESGKGDRGKTNMYATKREEVHRFTRASR